MRKITVFWVALCLVAASFPAGAAPEQKDGAKEFEEMMALMRKLAEPGPNHAFLTSQAGEWKTVTRSWTGPGEPVVSEGRATVTPILGGRFIREDLKGTFMNDPFEGFGITGYDNATKEFVTTWCDTLGTGLYLSNGSYDDATRTLHMSMKFDNPMTGKAETVRVEIEFLSDDEHVFSMFENREGKEVKTMEITYTRQ